MTNNEIVMEKLERGRAEFAYGKVKEALNRLDKDKQKDYRSYTRKIPPMILTNGLGQTLAFIKAKAEKKAYELIYQQLTEYFRTDSTSINMPQQDKNDLVEWVISCNSTNYRYITQEILALLNWLKRFAEGMIEEEGE